MRFDLSSEQHDLAQLASSFFERSRSADLAAALAGKGAGDPAVWARLSGEIGLTGIVVPEDEGGAGGSLVDLAVVLEAAGRHLSTQPLLASGGGAVAALRAGAGEQARTWLRGLASGELCGTWADPCATAARVTAVRGAAGWILEGRISHVPVVEGTNLVLVVAGTPHGDRVFGVQGTAGLAQHREMALDPTRPLATIDFTSSAAVPAHDELDAEALVRARAVTVVLLAAELAGVAGGAFEVARTHALERHQFGRAIGSFQAVKHLLADMFVDAETARDVSRYAAWSLAEGADNPAELAAMTHAHVSSCAVRVTSSMLQILGGMGYTWEHAAHLYYKRALSSARLLTTVERELDRLAGAVGLDGLR